MLSINYEHRTIGTKDAQIRFGHIHGDQVKSSFMIQGQESLEYITIDQTEPRKRWITSRCRGRYQVECGDDIPKDQIGMWFNATRSDILIQTKGRIRMEAENIDLIARGGDKKGVINLIANDLVNVKSDRFVAETGSEIRLFSNGDLFQSALNIMGIYAGFFEKLTSKCAIKPPNIPVIPEILNIALDK